MISSSEEVIYDRDEEPNSSSSVISNSERTHLFTNEIKLRRRNALKRKISKGKLIKKKGIRNIRNLKIILRT